MLLNNVRLTNGRGAGAGRGGGGGRGGPPPGAVPPPPPPGTVGRAIPTSPVAPTPPATPTNTPAMIVAAASPSPSPTPTARPADRGRSGRQGPPMRPPPSGTPTPTPTATPTAMPRPTPGLPPGAPATAQVTTITPVLDARGNLTIDMGPLRRDLFRQVLPADKRYEDLSPEERQRVAAEVNQRLLGIQQGLQIGAAELQKRAIAAEHEAEAKQTTAKAAVTTTSTVVGASAAPKPASSDLRKSSLSGNSIAVNVERNGQVVRSLNAEINLPNVLATVFSTTQARPRRTAICRGEGRHDLRAVGSRQGAHRHTRRRRQARWPRGRAAARLDRRHDRRQVRFGPAARHRASGRRFARRICGRRPRATPASACSSSGSRSSASCRCRRGSRATSARSVTRSAASRTAITRRACRSSRMTKSASSRSRSIRWRPTSSVISAPPSSRSASAANSNSDVDSARHAAARAAHAGSHASAGRFGAGARSRRRLLQLLRARQRPDRAADGRRVGQGRGRGAAHGQHSGLAAHSPRPRSAVVSRGRRAGSRHREEHAGTGVLDAVHGAARSGHRARCGT